MPTQITLPNDGVEAHADGPLAELYWLVGVLLLGIVAFLVMMHLPTEVLDALSTTPGL